MVNTFVCVCVCVFICRSPNPAGTAEFFTFSFLHFLQLSGRPNPAESPFVICSPKMDTTYTGVSILKWERRSRIRKGKVTIATPYLLFFPPPCAFCLWGETSIPAEQNMSNDITDMYLELQRLYMEELNWRILLCPDTYLTLES